MRLQNILGRIRLWNRRLHTHVGLLLLALLWLYALSGLMLNHPRWRFGEFWPQRKQSTSLHAIAAPAEPGDAARAEALRKQLDLRGEIVWTESKPSQQTLSFRLWRPEGPVTVRADLAGGTATVERTQVNAWGVMNAPHKFTGVSMDDPAQERDWLWTRLWSASVDATAGGLIFLVLSGAMQWLLSRRRPVWGLAFAAVGAAAAGFFLWIVPLL